MAGAVCRRPEFQWGPHS